MPLTTRGIWYPGTADTLSPRANFATLAANLDTVLRKERLHHSSNEYASAAARDAEYVAAGEVAAQGDQCTIAGVPYLYKSGAWVRVPPFEPTAMVANGTSTVAVANTTWTNLPLASVVESKGVDLTLGTNGIIAGVDMLVNVDVFASAGSNASGRRLMGIVRSSGVNPGTYEQASVGHGPVAGINNLRAGFNRVSLVSGDELIIKLYQDSGGSINYSSRRMSVERVS